MSFKTFYRWIGFIVTKAVIDHDARAYRPGKKGKSSLALCVIKHADGSQV